MASQAQGPGTGRQEGWGRRDFLRMAAGTALALFLPACRRAPSSPPAVIPKGWVDTERYKKSPPWRMGRSSRGDISAWMVMFSAHVEYGVQEKYRQYFRDYVSIAANWDPNKQIEDIRVLLATGTDLLLIDPLDTRVVAQGVTEALAAGIPVILAATRAGAAPYVSWVTTNSEERGAACADWLCRTISGGRVGILAGLFSADDGNLWLQGVQRRLELCPGVEPIVTRCSWSSAEARQAMALLLEQKTPLDGLIVQNGVLGRGAVQACVEHNRPIPPVAGADDWNGWLRTAKEYGVRFLSLSGGANLGLRCVQLAAQVLAGETVPAYVEFPYETFDQSALDRYYRPDLSDPYWAVHDLPEAWIQRMFRPQLDQRVPAAKRTSEQLAQPRR